MTDVNLFYYFLYPCIDRSGAYSSWPVCSSVYLSICKNFNNYWPYLVNGLSDKVLIFHMYVPCNKTFLLGPLYLIS
jgi:hypothetical protein